MKTTALLSAAFFAGAHSAATPGCGNSLSPRLTRGGADKTNALSFTTSSGVVRSYLLHVPTSYNAGIPAPLAFSYHGRNGNSKDQETISGMSNETFNPDYLVVYPQGLNAVWQGDPDATGHDDVGFSLELLANLTSTFCIDSSRIYAAGKSNGGGFAANILACDPQASRVFAAFGGIAGAYYQGNTDANCNGTTVPITCNPGRNPVPIFTTHGDSDQTIPYPGGGRRGRCLPTIPHFMTEWSVRNGLGSLNTSISLYSNNVVRYDYGNDSFPQLSAHYFVHGLDHTWPSIAAGSSFDATPLLLSFWNMWTLDTTPYNFLNATASAPVMSQTTSTRTSSAIASASGAPSASLCPSVNGQTVTDFNGNVYKVTCSADNSVGSYANTQASSSYLDCMNACDTAASAGCQGFTYVGGANGQNSGTCWLKKSMGTYTTSGSNTISAVRVSGSSDSNSASVTGSITPLTSSTSSSISSSAAPVASALSCPASNNQVYTYSENGAQFAIECGIDHAGGDMASTSVKNLEGCIAACATTVGCVDVSLSGVACYLKKTLGAAVNNGAILGARFIGTASTSSTSVSTSTLASTSSSSVASSSSAIISSIFTSSSSSTSSTPGSTGVVVTHVSSSSSSSPFSSIVSSSVGADGYTTTSYPPTCTAINTDIYAVTDNSGKPYLFMCGGGSAGGTAQTISNVANWTACFQACDSYTGCTGFSYNQGAALGNGVGQCLIKTDSPQSFVSTAQLLNTRVAGFIRPITATSGSSSTSLSASLASSASVLTTSPSVMSSSSSSLRPSTTPSMTSFSTSTTTSSSSATVSSSNALTSISSSSSSRSSSSSVSLSSSSLSLVSSSSSSSTVTAPSSTPIPAPSCPVSNGTTYADAGGIQYIVLCTYDTSINTITASSSVGSFGDCAVLCDKTSGCKGLTWNGTSCSLKQSFGQYILGAVKA